MHSMDEHSFCAQKLLVFISICFYSITFLGVHRIQNFAIRPDPHPLDPDMSEPVGSYSLYCDQTSS